ncbi:hypothetical protein OROHE_016191 [Orobanche hederae]
MTRILLILKLLLILIFAGWVSLWVLRPTGIWTKKWKKAEEIVSSSVFDYNGLDFAVYTFPVIALAITGFIYMELKSKEPRSRQDSRNAFTRLHDPLFVNRYIGILSGAQILASSLFIMFLVWTFYARVSNDFNKMTPIKSLKSSLMAIQIVENGYEVWLVIRSLSSSASSPRLKGDVHF